MLKAESCPVFTLTVMTCETAPAAACRNVSSPSHCEPDTLVSFEVPARILARPTRSSSTSFMLIAWTGLPSCGSLRRSRPPKFSIATAW
jgi:hypothetical protein